MYNGGVKPQNRMVDMYHAGTPEAVENHICADMVHDHGQIRVLISTIAFGMGINCKKVRRVVHFCPSKTVESYVQECGRAGNYNGLLSVHCDGDMKQYLETDGCLRQCLMANFGYKVDHSKINLMHECCYSCMQNCKCGNSICGQFWSPQLSNDCDMP